MTVSDGQVHAHKEPSGFSRQRNVVARGCRKQRKGYLEITDNHQEAKELKLEAVAITASSSLMLATPRDWVTLRPSSNPWGFEADQVDAGRLELQRQLAALAFLLLSSPSLNARRHHFYSDFLMSSSAHHVPAWSVAFKVTMGG